MGFFDKLKKINIFANFGSELTDDFYDELEESLILADTAGDLLPLSSERTSWAPGDRSFSSLSRSGSMKFQQSDFPLLLNRCSFLLKKEPEL